MKHARSRSLFAANQARIVAILCALLDGSVWIAAYRFTDFAETGGSYFALYYAAAVPCKLAVLLVFIKTVRLSNLRRVWPFYVPIVSVVLVSLLTGNSTLEGVIQPVGAIVSLLMTIAILSGENVTTYMKTFGISCFLACATFLFQLKFVPLNSSLGVWEASGRYTFIFGTQPNLGGEVLFAGFVASCIARTKTMLLAGLFVLYFISLNYMESRAALLALLLAFSMCMYVDKIKDFTLGTKATIVGAILLLLLGFFTLNHDRIADIFLLNDEYRGAGSGFVGREDRWQAAWQTFVTYPVFGAGFNYFGREVITPHSMWLGLLGMMGFMSVFVVVAMFKNGARIYRINTKIFFMLLSAVPMTFFNDRVLNLNPYPFLFYVILFLPNDALMAAVDAPMRRIRAGAAIRLGRHGLRA
ncbi:O-antigen ligase family protein [Bradyrhizobium symbiodeficiens]|uniref:O-antigen ligase family protein n=1 Tax=Bradyrhizobium symbiodeficiens TaxID=1404367 RepID=UPI0030D5930E